MQKMDTALMLTTTAQAIGRGNRKISRLPAEEQSGRGGWDCKGMAVEKQLIAAQVDLWFLSVTTSQCAGDVACAQAPRKAVAGSFHRRQHQRPNKTWSWRQRSSRAQQPGREVEGIVVRPGARDCSLLRPPARTSQRRLAGRSSGGHARMSLCAIDCAAVVNGHAAVDTL